METALGLSCPSLPEASAIVIRDIDRLEELRAVEALQKEVWGCADLDIVPADNAGRDREVGGVVIAPTIDRSWSDLFTVFRDTKTDM